MGGGGRGDEAGAGSGYIQYQMISVAAGATVISAEVGTTAQPSAVSINGATILAKQGGEIFNVTSSEGSFRQHEGENDEEPGEVIDENEAAVFE